jgi:hypothetical protein
MAKFGNLTRAADSDRRVLNLYDEYLLHRDPKAEADQIRWISNKNADRDRVGTWSASSAGSCLRQQQFTFLGMPKGRPTPEQLNIFANGDFLHLRYQVAGLVAGWLSDVEVPLTVKTVRGTADGILRWGEVLELKSINDYGFKNVLEFGPKEAHKRQATAYMIATGLPSTRFVYENKNTNANVEFLYHRDEDTVISVLDEWARLDILSARRELAPMLEPCTHQDGFDYKYCPYNKLCSEASWPVRPLRIVRTGSGSSETSRSPIPAPSSSVSASLR